MAESRAADGAGSWRLSRSAAYRFFSRSAISFARSVAMRSINFTGTVPVSGNRMVPLLTLYGASSSFKAATTGAVAG